ncbi:MAG: hypothetical protein ABIP03_00095 [Aquihabitans sp.]
MIWLFAVLGVVVVIVIGLLMVGREASRLGSVARPAVFDLAEAIDFIADRLSPEAQSRLSHDDVRWILLADADLLESATAPAPERRYPWSRLPPGPDPRYLDDSIVDQDLAVARILTVADESGRALADEDVAAVLDARLGYLEVIGAIGPQA